MKIETVTPNVAATPKMRHRDEDTSVVALDRDASSEPLSTRAKHGEDGKAF
jgi:hypothetical protein